MSNRAKVFAYKKAEAEEYLKKIQVLCEEFWDKDVFFETRLTCLPEEQAPAVQESLWFKAEIVDSKGRVVFVLMDEMHPERTTLQEVKSLLEKELRVHKIRSRNIEEIARLQASLKDKSLGKIFLSGWRKEPLFGSDIGISHKVSYENISTEWTTEGLEEIKTLVRKHLKEADDLNVKAWSVLTRKSVKGELVEIYDESNRKMEGELRPGALKVCAEEIVFCTHEEALSACNWALSKGAFLSHHHSMGEKWRNLAKKEEWTQKECMLANALLRGEELSKKEVCQGPRTIGMNDLSGSRSSSGDYKAWFLGDIFLYKEYGDFVQRVALLLNREDVAKKLEKAPI